MKKIFFILSFTVIINNLSAQNRFGGGVVLGFNAAQMDGDFAAGYHKVGLNVGLRGTTRLNDNGKWLLTTEMLLSQRGARTVDRDGANPDWKATLNYLEVPVLVSYLDWAQEEGAYYKVHFTGGVSYGRLFSTKISFPFTHPQEVIDVFGKSDVSYTAGISYFVNSNLGFTGRYSRSFGYLFHPKNYKENVFLNGLTALQGYFLTFQTCWMF
ncbi:MAG: outer membrane beta-barrel protein [Saprospiraceae bacterium]|nr:outer membrane beta-barrel protein [Saprospiraceae bacterium]